MNHQDVENDKPEEVTIAVGLLDWRVIEKPAPIYPTLTKKANLRGRTVVEVLIDKSGKVENAVIVSGHPLVHSAVLKAARQAKFYPTFINGQLVKVSGLLTYGLEPSNVVVD